MGKSLVSCFLLTHGVYTVTIIYSRLNLVLHRFATDVTISAYENRQLVVTSF